MHRAGATVLPRCRADVRVGAGLPRRCSPAPHVGDMRRDGGRDCESVDWGPSAHVTAASAGEPLAPPRRPIRSARRRARGRSAYIARRVEEWAAHNGASSVRRDQQQPHP
eukprot:scaffold3822_cov379-Prasinococcus_capsulatus_cf.AAC.5